MVLVCTWSSKCVLAFKHLFVSTEKNRTNTSPPNAFEIGPSRRRDNQLLAGNWRTQEIVLIYHFTKNCANLSFLSEDRLVVVLMNHVHLLHSDTCTIFQVPKSYSTAFYSSSPPLTSCHPHVFKANIKI